MSEERKQRLLPGKGDLARWPQRVLMAALGLGLAIVAFFFAVFALIAGAIVVTVIGIRFWWFMRKVREQEKNTAALEGEYTVVDRAGTVERLER